MTESPPRPERSGDPAGGLDPTKMANQPALRTSSGRVWIVVGALFAAASLVPFGLLIFAGDGRSRPIATVAAVLVVVLYALLLVCRFTLRPGPGRLRAMAACMLTMAGVALVGIWICAVVEGAPPP